MLFIGETPRALSIYKMVEKALRNWPFLSTANIRRDVMLDIVNHLDRMWVIDPDGRPRVDQHLDQVSTAIGLIQTPMSGRLGKSDSPNPSPVLIRTTPKTRRHKSDKQDDCLYYPSQHQLGDHEDNRPLDQLDRVKSKSVGDLSGRSFEMKKLKAFFDAAPSSPETAATEPFSSASGSESSDESKKMPQASAYPLQKSRLPGAAMTTQSGNFLFDDWFGFKSYAEMQKAVEEKFFQLGIPVTIHDDWSQKEDLEGPRPTPDPSAKGTPEARLIRTSRITSSTRWPSFEDSSADGSRLREFSTTQSTTLGSVDTSETSTTSTPVEDQRQVSTRQDQGGFRPFLPPDLSIPDEKPLRLGAFAKQIRRVGFRSPAAILEQQESDREDQVVRKLTPKEFSSSGVSSVNSSFGSIPASPYASSTPQTGGSSQGSSATGVFWAVKAAAGSTESSPSTFSMSNDEALGNLSILPSNFYAFSFSFFMLLTFCLIIQAPKNIT